MKTLLTLILLTGAAFAQSPSVKLTWAAAPTNPPGVTYNLYRVAPGATPVKINTSPINALEFTDTNIGVCQAYTYYATTERPGVPESRPSNSADAAIPCDPPTGFTVTLDLTATTTIKGTIQVAGLTREALERLLTEAAPDRVTLTAPQK